MRSILAKACGERTKYAASARSGLMSSPKRPCPRSSASSSMRPAQADGWARRAAIDESMKRSDGEIKGLQLAIGDAGLGVELVDVRFHARLRLGVGLMRPADLGAGIDRHLLVLLRGAAADAIGADHLAAAEHRGAATGRGYLAVGQRGQTDQQLRIALLEPLLDHQPVGKARAHRAERRHRVGLGDGGIGGDKACLLYALDRD